MAAATFVPASPKQHDFIAGLAAVKAIPAEAARELFKAARANLIDKGKASDLIDSLMGEADREVPVGVHVAPEGSPWEGQRIVVKRSKGGRLYSVTEGDEEYLNGQGLFLLDADTLVAKAPAATEVSNNIPVGIHVTPEGDFRDVVRSRNGQLYAKGLNEGTGKFSDYLGKAGLRGLSEETKITAEQAAEFGHRHGRCVFCAKALTDERSVEVGYGPTCAENNALPWGETTTKTEDDLGPF